MLRFTEKTCQVLKVKLSKHDRYVRELKNRVQDQYDTVSLHVALKNKKRSFAEIDLLAKDKDGFDVYEVKCSHRITKAKKQFKKIRKYFPFKINNYFFYCGSSKLLLAL